MSCRHHSQISRWMHRKVLSFIYYCLWLYMRTKKLSISVGLLSCIHAILPYSLTVSNTCLSNLSPHTSCPSSYPPYIPPLRSESIALKCIRLVTDRLTEGVDGDICSRPNLVGTQMAYIPICNSAVDPTADSIANTVGMVVPTVGPRVMVEVRVGRGHGSNALTVGTIRAINISFVGCKLSYQ